MKEWKIRPVYDRRGRALKASGTGRVEIEVYFSRESRVWFPLDVEIYPNEWDREHGAVVGRKDAKRLTSIIRCAVNKYDSILDKIVSSGLIADAATLRRWMDAEKQRFSGDFYRFALGELTKRDVKAETKRMHLMALDALKRSGCVRTFEDVTPENIQAFDIFLRREDSSRSQVTIHGYHKRIKPYILEAVRLGLVPESPYRVFKDVRGKSKERQALNADELRRMREIDLTDPSLSKARDLFIFQCYTGLSWCDLSSFRFDAHVAKVDGLYFIDGARIKTGSQYYTPILPPALAVLQKYDYKLRVPTCQAYNRLLKVVAMAANIKKDVTSHIARHTFATTVALGHDVPMESLMKMMGHHDISITKIYAKVMHTDVERNAVRLAAIIK